jgi:alpha-beta hydrolase superfamily lysophospholipase
MARKSENVRLPLMTGGELQAYVSYRDEPSDWAVLYVHGFTSTRGGEKSEALEAACAARGWTFASFDFRGHGESTGTLLELRGTGLLEDLDAMRDYLVSRGIHQLCPVGSSMGGWASAWFTIRHPASVPGCVLIAPGLDFLRSRWAALTEVERETWRVTGKLPIRSQWTDAELGYGLVEEIDLFPLDVLASDLARPVLIFHGLQDDVVPVANSLAFLERAAYPGIELRIYKDGDHRLLSHKSEMADAACNFFTRCLADRRHTSPEH